MARKDRIKWLQRIGGGVALVLLLAAVYVAWNWSAMSNARLAQQVRTSATEEERLAAARKLVAGGEKSQAEVRMLLINGEPEACAAVAVALHESLDDLPPDDPRTAAMGKFLLDMQAQCAEPGQLAIGELLPTLLRGASPDLVAKARETVKASLAQSSPEVTRRAVRLAMRPDLGLKAEIVPVLNHPEACVRKEAMLAIGPAMAGDPVIGDEELFHWLHDADIEVRLLCEAALSTRGLEPDQINAARKLTHPDASERLSLLVELRFSGESLGEPGPWLERLSRDADPAIRAGAARVACERKLPFATWVKRLAKEDPDAGVRQIAEFHRGKMELQQAGFNGD
jgi:hypothetical protein